MLNTSFLKHAGHTVFPVEPTSSAENSLSRSGKNSQWFIECSLKSKSRDAMKNCL